MDLEKPDVNVPVTGDHSVTTLVHVVAKIVQDRLIRRRPRLFGIATTVGVKAASFWLRR
jgi:hypothetical protein